MVHTINTRHLLYQVRTWTFPGWIILLCFIAPAPGRTGGFYFVCCPSIPFQLLHPVFDVDPSDRWRFFSSVAANCSILTQRLRTNPQRKTKLAYPPFIDNLYFPLLLYMAQTMLRYCPGKGNKHDHPTTLIHVHGDFRSPDAIAWSPTEATEAPPQLGS